MRSNDDGLERIVEGDPAPHQVNATLDMLAPRIDEMPTSELPRHVVTAAEMSERIRAEYAEAIERDRRRNRVLLAAGAVMFLAGSFALGTQIPRIAPEIADAVSRLTSPTAGVSIEAVPTSTILGEKVGVMSDGSPYVTGTLLNPDGSPAAGAEVAYNVYDRDGDGLYSVKATCSRNGEYVVLCAEGGDGWDVGSVEYVGEEVAPGGYLTRKETADTIAAARSSHAFESVACEGDAAPEDGSLGLWRDGYYLVHDWSPTGQEVLSVAPGDGVSLDGADLVACATRDVPRGSTVADVEGAYDGDFDAIIQTCIPDDESSMRIVYLVAA